MAVSTDDLIALKARNLSWKEIGAQTGLTWQAVRGRVRRAGKIIVDDGGLYYPSARDIHDREAWEDYLNHATRRGKMLTILFLPDMHIPDTNWQAFALARQIRRYIRPQVDFFLGDEHDLDTLSTHWQRAENRKRRDAFKELAPYWYQSIDSLDADYKSEFKVMIGANHTYGRIEDYVNARAPELADTIIETYITIARAGGRVNWLGWSDETWINHYHIEHGTRLGENSAKNSLKDAGWSSPRTGGHVHAPSEAWNYTYTKGDRITEPRRHIVQSVTLPCLCNIHPHYAGDKKKARWMNGVGIAYVNLNGLDVHQHKIIFHTRDNGDMVAAFGSQVFVEKRVNQKVAAA